MTSAVTGNAIWRASYAWIQSRTSSLISGKKQGKKTKAASVCQIGPTDLGLQPSQDDLLRLRRVSGRIPWSALSITAVEVLERLSFNGTLVVVINFLQQPLPPNSKTGRYRTIQWSSMFEFMGHLVLIVAALPWVIVHPQPVLAPFVFGLILLGIGFGGMKPNITALILEQIPDTKLRIAIDKKGQQVIIDPELTRSRVLLYLYSFVNIGSISGMLSMTYARTPLTLLPGPALRQMNSNMISQAATLDLGRLPNDLLINLNPFFCTILVPIYIHIIYPTLSRFNINFSPTRRICAGFASAATGMAITAIIQYAIYRESTCGSSTAQCSVSASKLSVWVQLPVYLLLANSEILAVVTGIEYAYSHAPTNMRSVVMALFYFTGAWGSAFAQALLPLSEDPYLVWNYTTAGGLSYIAAVGVWWFHDAKPEKPENAVMVELVEVTHVGAVEN
ncbi:hypothetical protein N0V90_010332 [Kalmusia sp. IMI 367209]|nr:hypothetical protein N0V90_010332 [Kalmusia sp. IMI 367209]